MSTTTDAHIDMLHEKIGNVKAIMTENIFKTMGNCEKMHDLQKALAALEAQAKAFKMISNKAATRQRRTWWALVLVSGAVSLTSIAAAVGFAVSQLQHQQQ